MSKRTRIIQFLTLALFGLSLAACDNAVFSNTDPSNKAVGLDDPGTGGPGGPGTVNENGDLVFLDDSFEREDLFGDLDNNIIVGWRGAWEDHGTLGTGFTGNQLGMEIFTDQEMGPAFDGERATYFYGRPGSSIHTLWLVSPTYDLSDYNTVIMNYRYLTIALNDQADIDANYIEAIRLQVCAAGANACGANADFIDLNAIGNDANWVTVAESDVNEDDDAFDGKNHAVADFITDLAVFDLNNPDFVSDKSEVVIRFEVDMRDGFASGTTTVPNPDYDEYKCEKYKKKKKKYCGKIKKYCDKAEKYKNKCGQEDHESGAYDTQSGYELLTQTYGHSDHCGHGGHAYGHCIQKCIKGNIGRDAKHACLHSCKSCKKAHKYKKKCEKKKRKYGHKCKRYTEKVEKYCDKGDDVVTQGTMVDGVILDLVQGIATERDISEIF